MLEEVNVMSQLKNGFKNKSYSKETMLRSIQKDIYKKPQRKLFYVLTAFAVAILLYIGTSEKRQEQLVQSVYARVSIDINPSIELAINEDEIVVAAYPFNVEAEEMNLDKLLGMNVSDAIEKIIKMAEDLGYLDIVDATQDYVVIATYSEEESTLDLDEDLAQDLVDKGLKAESIVFLEATDEEAAEAEENHQSLGITILNGLLQTNDGTALLNEINEPLTVKEFVSNSSNLTYLTERAIVITEQDQHMTNLIARFLEEIDEYDVSLDAYTEELGSATDLVKLKTVMAKIRSELHVEEVQAAKNTEEETALTTEEKVKSNQKTAEARDLAEAIRAAQKAEAATERENKKTDTEE